MTEIGRAVFPGARGLRSGPAWIPAFAGMTAIAPVEFVPTCGRKDARAPQGPGIAGLDSPVIPAKAVNPLFSSREFA